MPYIQENKTRGYWNGKRVGKKPQSRFSITIPKWIIEEMAWQKGDEIEFRIEKGKAVLRRKK